MGNRKRPYRTATVSKLRGLVQTIRDELAERKTPTARRLREEIDPEFEIERARDCCVYVIELDREVRLDDGFKAANPNMRDDRDCLYVGSTFLTPEARLQQHLEGVEHSAIRVRKFGKRLRPEFFERYPPFTRAEAEQEEKALALLLRREGYGVWQA